MAGQRRLYNGPDIFLHNSRQPSACAFYIANKSRQRVGLGPARRLIRPNHDASTRPAGRASSSADYIILFLLAERLDPTTSNRLNQQQIAPTRSALDALLPVSSSPLD